MIVVDAMRFPVYRRTGTASGELPRSQPTATAATPSSRTSGSAVPRRPRRAHARRAPANRPRYGYSEQIAALRLLPSRSLAPITRSTRARGRPSYLPYPRLPNDGDRHTLGPRQGRHLPHAGDRQRPDSTSPGITSRSTTATSPAWPSCCWCRAARRGCSPSNSPSSRRRGAT